MIALRTALFFAGWVSATLALGLLALPLLASRPACWWFARIWARGTLLWLRLCCGIRSETRGQEYLPKGGGLVASKHQSAWDTLMLWCALGNPVFVLKRELYRIPIFGWYLWRCGNIGIDRRAGRVAAEQMLEQAQHFHRAGRCIVIFPEGTRVPPGEARAFHTGVARLSTQLPVTVTPVALNAGNFWPKHTLCKYPGTAVMQCLAPHPACDGQLQPWLLQLQETINEASLALG